MTIITRATMAIPATPNWMKSTKLIMLVFRFTRYLGYGMFQRMKKETLAILIIFLIISGYVFVRNFECFPSWLQIISFPLLIFGSLMFCGLLAGLFVKKSRI